LTPRSLRRRGYFNVKVTSLLDYAEIKMNIEKDCTSTATSTYDLLCELSPDAVVEFLIKLFKRTIGLVSVFDNERLWRFIIELSDKSSVYLSFTNVLG